MLFTLAKQALLGMVRSRSFSICQIPTPPHETLFDATVDCYPPSKGEKLWVGGLLSHQWGFL